MPKYSQQRPKRSAKKPDSYAIRLDIGTSGSSGEDDLTRPSEKSRDKRRAPSTEDELASGSEYHDQPRDSGSADDVEIDAEEGAIEDESEQSEKEVTPSTPGPHASLPVAPSQTQRRHPRTSEVIKSAVLPSPKRARRTKGTKSTPIVQSGGGRTVLDFRVPTWDQMLGPLYQPDPTFRLPGDFHDERNVAPTSTPLVQEYGVDQTTRIGITKAWLKAWYGLAWHLVEDLSFYKQRKAPAPGSPNVLGLEAMEEQRARPYLPRQIHGPGNRGRRSKMQANGADDHIGNGIEPPDDEEDESGAFTLNMGLPKLSGEYSDHEVSLERFEAVRLDGIIPSKAGYLFNAGGPVFALDWLPPDACDSPPAVEYIALGTYSEPRMVSPQSAPAIPASMGLLQIWEIPARAPADFGPSTNLDGHDTAYFAFGLCVDVGEAWKLQWRPSGYDKGAVSLGHLAGAFSEGSLCVFDVPNPASSDKLGIRPMLHCQPLLRLLLPDTAVNSFEWSSSDRIIGACGNGYIAVWNVSEVIQRGLPTLRPSIYVPTEAAPLIDLCIIRLPPISSDGHEELEDEPQMIGLCDYSGQFMALDLRDPHSVVPYFHERGGGSRVSWSPSLGSIVSVDADNNVRLTCSRPRSFTNTLRLLSMNGTVNDIDCSNYSPFIALGSSDGTCAVDNALRHHAKTIHPPIYGKFVFRLDYNRNTGGYRMYDNEVPLAVAGKLGTSMTEDAPSATWPPQLAVTRVRWAQHIRRAHVLASGMACGLVRIDMILDRASGTVSGKEADELWALRSDE